MREGSLEAPIRHPIDWQNPDFYDEAKLDAELRRVFDICHGCRRCFNLCDTFPRLFDLVDESQDGRTRRCRARTSSRVVDACTLCDMCFMTKCPYVPPHEFDLDFPHLMLRYRAVEAKKDENSFADRRSPRPTATASSPRPSRRSPTGRRARRTSSRAALMEKVAGIDARAELPTYASSPLTSQAKASTPEINREAPAFGRKAVIYATCFINYNDPDVGLAARAVLAQQRRRDGSRASRMLRHADAGAGRIGEVAEGRQDRVRGARAVDREGLRRDRARALLRADAEVRVAADRARRREREDAGADTRSTSANTSSTSPRRTASRPASSRSPGGVDGAHRLPRPRAEHGPEGGGDAAAASRGRGRR